MSAEKPAGWRVEIGLPIAGGSPNATEHCCIGSGTLIGPRQVLTARHVVVGRMSGKVNAGLVVRVGPDTDGKGAGELCEVALVHLPEGDDPPDVAVIELTEELPARVVEVRALKLKEEKACSIAGYPALRDFGRPAGKLIPTRGNAYACHGGTEKLQLSFDKEKQEWKNLSGAAIRVDHIVVGVLRGHPGDFRETRVDATPAAAFMGHPWFCKAMGWADSADKVDGWCAARVAAVAQVLGKHRGLREALHAQLYEEVAADKDEEATLHVKVARALLREPPDQIAELVAVAAEAARQDGGGQHGLSALTTALPGSAQPGHRVRLVQVHAQVAAGGQDVSVPARDPLVTEVFAAGAEERDLAMVAREGDGKLKPAHLLDPPAAMGAALRQTAALTRDAISQDIRARFGAAGHHRAIYDLLEEGIEPAAAKGRMQRAFEGEGRGRLKKRHAFYVVVADQDCGDKSLADHAHAVLVEALFDLPHVRIYRNTATDDATIKRDGAVRQYAQQTHDLAYAKDDK